MENNWLHLKFILIDLAVLKFWYRVLVSRLAISSETFPKTTPWESLRWNYLSETWKLLVSPLHKTILHIPSVTHLSLGNDLLSLSDDLLRSCLRYFNVLPTNPSNGYFNRFFLPSNKSLKAFMAFLLLGGWKIACKWNVFILFDYQIENVEMIFKKKNRKCIKMMFFLEGKAQQVWNCCHCVK